jgi:hypothetical protein
MEVRKVGGVGDSLAWATRLPPTLCVARDVASPPDLQIVQESGHLRHCCVRMCTQETEEARYF